MDPARWDRIGELFDAAMELAPEDRGRFLNEQCAGDASLRQRVEEMLHEDLGTDPIHRIVQGASAAVAEAQDAWAGRRLGAYRVLRRIGRGGMGSVFLAVRDDEQYRKEVAIKTLKFEASDALALTRFRHERQVLAGLEHANIARLLDGGTSETGMPFIVMEYIPGIPITEYCREKGLSIEARVRLFRQVCDAVQYAHQRLVVHRDIKPANILVTSDGVPKLVDFGIAKFLDSADTAEAVTRTMTGFLLMTPEYASPEQLRGASVSTATDVYSLGAVLYEVLTGARARTLKTTDPAELARAVTEDDVKMPSSIAGRRLRGDLDNIVLKAMHKEPARRYQSAGQFSEDLERFLEGRPVLARPDSFAYRAGKYMRRHWLGVTAVAAVILALAGGIGIAAREARLARERFQDVRTLANRFLFDFHDAIADVPGTTKARELIVSTALDYLGKLEKTARQDPALERELAAAYVKVAIVQGFPGEPNLGRISDSRKSFQRAIEIYDRLRVTTPDDIALELDALARLAYLEDDQAQYDAALEWSRRAVALAERIPLAQMPPALVHAYATVLARSSDAVEGKGDSEAAYVEVRRAESVLKEYAARDRSGKFDSRPVVLLSYLETAARRSGRLEEAVAFAEEVFRKSGQTPAARTRYNARVSEVYASIDEPSWDDPAKALPLVLESVRGYEQSLRTDPNDINTKYSLAVNNSKIGYYLRESNPAAAVRALDYTISLFEAMARQDPGNTEFPGRLARYRARMALARSYLHQRDQVEALSAQVLAGTFEDEQDRLHVLNLCGLALANVGSRVEASRIFEQATRIAADLLSKTGKRMTLQIEATRAFEQQAEFMRQSGDVADAERLLEEARRVWLQREPETTYVRIRRGRAERLLSSLRSRGQ
ncbi:MAG TPA: serine/threonine-protein kinase [Bryobacteraceae bacterium]|nr:serine/threonine-protein kinase [Bryobacteraceae bacterium]